MSDKRSGMQDERVALEVVIADAAEAFLRLTEALRRLKREHRAEPATGGTQWLSLRDVARELGVSYGTAWNIARSGAIPSTLLRGGRGQRAIRRIARDALAAYILQSSQPNR